MVHFPAANKITYLKFRAMMSSKHPMIMFDNGQPKVLYFFACPKKYHGKMGQAKDSFLGSAGSLSGDPAGTRSIVLFCLPKKVPKKGTRDR